MHAKQGAIYFADLNPVKGSEQAGFRPVLVAQNDIMNKYLNTTVIVPITSNLKYKKYITNLFLPKETSGLPQDSVALAHQVRALDVSRLIKKAGKLSAEDMQKLKRCLSLVF